MFLFLATVACDTDTKQQPANKDMVLLTDQQIRSLASKRIFFGHQSVGDNILQGIRDLKASDPRLTLNLVSSADPETISGPAFIETHIGVNRNPDSKNDAFYAICRKVMAHSMGSLCTSTVISTSILLPMCSRFLVSTATALRP